MRRLSSAVFLIIFFLLFAFGAFARDEREIREVPTPPQPPPPQQTRPILPPQVPTPPPTLSPTPSPHIAAPPTDATLMMRQTGIQPQPQVGTIPAMQEILQVSITGNVFGKVLSIDYDERGIPSIEVNDELFGTAHKINIISGRTGIVKANKIINLGDIKTGDTVNVLYTEQDFEKEATFVTVLTPEELEIIEQIQSETVVKSEELKQQENPATEPTETPEE